MQELQVMRSANLEFMNKNKFDGSATLNDFCKENK